MHSGILLPKTQQPYPNVEAIQFVKDFAQGLYNTKQIKENGRVPLPFVLAWLWRGRNIDTANAALPLSKKFLERCDLELVFYSESESTTLPTNLPLSSRVENIESTLTQHIIALAFLSVKQIIMMKWKIHKPNCFNIDHWLKDVMDVNGTGNIRPQ